MGTRESPSNKSNEVQAVQNEVQAVQQDNFTDLSSSHSKLVDRELELLREQMSLESKDAQQSVPVQEDVQQADFTELILTPAQREQAAIDLDIERLRQARFEESLQESRLQQARLDIEQSRLQQARLEESLHARFQAHIKGEGLHLAEYTKNMKEQTNNVSDQVRKTKSESQTFTITISSKQVEKLKMLAETQKISATSALEKAIETEFYLKEKIRRRCKILVQNQDKSIQEIVFK